MAITLNDKTSRVLAAKTTRFAARKGSSFLYFAYDRDMSTLVGYTKTGIEISVTVPRSALRCFLEADLKLRGQVFGQIMGESEIAPARKLTATEYSDALIKVKRDVVLPARKSGHFQDFKVRALKSEAKFTVIGQLKAAPKTKLLVVLNCEQMAEFAATSLRHRDVAFAALVSQAGAN